MDLRVIGGYYRQERAHYLELDLLVPLFRALADLVDYGVDELPRESPVAPGAVLLCVEAIVGVVPIHEAVGHQFLDVVQNLLCELGDLGIQAQL